MFVFRTSKTKIVSTNWQNCCFFWRVFIKGAVTEEYFKLLILPILFKELSHLFDVFRTRKVRNGIYIGTHRPIVDEVAKYRTSFAIQDVQYQAREPLLLRAVSAGRRFLLWAPSHLDIQIFNGAVDQRCPRTSAAV